MVWKGVIGDNLEKTIIEAEKRMYEDKEEYYKKSGIERRKN